jgi:hypothetical protein
LLGWGGRRYAIMSELVVAAPSGASPSVVAPTAITDGGAADDAPPGAAARVAYLPFKGEFQMAEIVALIERDLSEPYSVFTYRYFIWQWPHMCLLVRKQARAGSQGGVACGCDTVGVCPPCAGARGRAYCGCNYRQD